MSETTEKIGFFKKTWKYIVTGVTCAAVGVGVTIGADVAKVQETITKAQARNVALAAAAYSAEQVLTKVTVVGTSENKATAVKEVLNEVSKAMPTFMEAANTVKEATVEVKAEAQKVKEEVTAVKEEAKKEEKKTETVPTVAEKK